MRVGVEGGGAFSFVCFKWFIIAAASASRSPSVLPAIAAGFGTSAMSAGLAASGLTSAAAGAAASPCDADASVCSFFCSAANIFSASESISWSCFAASDLSAADAAPPCDRARDSGHMVGKQRVGR